MKISIITLFPQIFDDIFSLSIPGRARRGNKIEIVTVDLRQFGLGRHKTVDDKPYGGGAGMVLRVDVLTEAINATKTGETGEAVILLDPRGVVYKQEAAENLSKYKHLIFVCAHYEGVDERIRKLIDFEISIGDFVLSGGEIPAMLIIDSIIRLVPGVLIKENATVFESHSQIGGERLLEYPQYTRPRTYKKQTVPKILVSGDSQKIEEYRQKKAKSITKKHRPDLLK